MSQDEDIDLVPLPFSVVEKSSEESGHEASKLSEFREDGEGWQSLPQSDDTERLVLKVHHQDEERMVHTLEILCHENKIPEKIEISLGCDNKGDGDSFNQCTSICHLGYITLDSNERSGYQARELKSIPIDKPAEYVQLTLRGCHDNSHNTDKVVSLVGVRLLGVAPAVNEGQVHEEATAAAAIDKIEAPIASASKNVPIKKVDSSRNAKQKKIAVLPSHVRKELDPKTQSSVDRLESLKKSRASLEDFETAGKIKDALSVVYALLTEYKECEGRMREAAAAEDYGLASQLKNERDMLKAQASKSLLDVEQQFVGRQHVDEIGDLSISTIKDESFISQRSKNFSPKKSFTTPEKCIASHPEKSEIGEDGSCDDDCMSSHDGEHPLKGVENAEELPAPEDVSDAVPSDLANNVEEYFGNYVMKCFFSKNWLLREASLAKGADMLSEICSSSNDACTGIMIRIIESAIDDKNVQVYLEALVFLSRLLAALESTEPPAKITPLLSRVVSNLLNKLMDANQKVVESAELTLLSLSSSPCVDISTIINAATKRVRSKESKGGRAEKARLSFLSTFFAEFEDTVPWLRAVEFAKGQKSFEHKDGGVRDAAKSLIITLMAVHGEKIILEPLQDTISERLLGEFRMRFAMIKQRKEILG